MPQDPAAWPGVAAGLVRAALSFTVLTVPSRSSESGIEGQPPVFGHG